MLPKSLLRLCYHSEPRGSITLPAGVRKGRLVVALEINLKPNMKKTGLVFMFLLLSLFTQAQEIDSIQVSDSDNKFKFGVRLGVNASYLNFGESGIFEVSKDVMFGGSFGFRLDWRITDYNRIRVEPYYFLQQFENRFEQEGLIILSEFQNHGAGMDVFPVVLQIGGKVKPTVSLGGFINYLVSSQSESQINEKPVDYEFTDLEKIQGGIVAGGGLYLGKTLMEVRFYKYMTDLISGLEETNRINQVSFIIAF